MLASDFLFVISIPLYLVFLFMHFKKKIKLTKIVLNSLLYFYIIGVIAVTLFPFPIQQSVIEEGIKNHYAQNNFIPLTSLIEIMQKDFSLILKQIGGNIVLAMPLGFLVPLIWKHQNHWTKILKIGFLFSCSIEIVQLLLSLVLGFTYKITDVDDILLNTLGSLLGYFLLKICIPVFMNKIYKFKNI